MYRDPSGHWRDGNPHDVDWGDPSLRAGAREGGAVGAVKILKTLPGTERTEAFRTLAAQITSATNGQWNAEEIEGANGTLFSGEGGEALGIDFAGNLYRGHLGDQLVEYSNGITEINFASMRMLK